MRLIDADALVERLEKSHEYHARTSREEVLLARDIRIIKEQPTIDAEPVRHGRWEEYPDSAHRRCTNCKKEFEKAKFSILALRCPICGAIMDGGAGCGPA